MEEALARLRSLRNDEERMNALEQYGQLKFALANELWKEGIQPRATGPRSACGPKESRTITYTGSEVHGHATVDDPTSSATTAPEASSVGSAGTKMPYDKNVENTINWQEDDPRFCRSCHHPNQVILRFANQYCVTWKCNWCTIRTAQQWVRGHTKYDGGRIQQHAENCLCALAELTYEVIENDDEIARIDTMCTLTMHGE
jgi:hypothetical protein